MKTAEKTTRRMTKILSSLRSALSCRTAAFAAAMATAVILAAVTVAAALPAAAAVSDFPDSDKTGTITIHKFNAQNFDNLKDPEGVEADEKNLPADAEAAEGVTFTLQRLDDSVGVATVKSKLDGSFPAQSQKTDSEGKISFPNLKKGYYLVTETVPSGYTAQKQAFIVMLPMHQNDAKTGEVTWNYDVHVYPKDSGSAPVLTKEVSSNEKVVGVGSEVEWTITYAVDSSALKAKNGDGTTVYAKDFHITDQMDTRMDYTEKSAVFTAYDKDKKPVGTVSLTAGTDYTEEYDKTKHLVTWAYTEAGVKKLAESNVSSVQVVIKSTINESARDSVTYVWNNASIDFTNAQGDPFHIEIFDPKTDLAGAGDNVPKVYLGSITIDKYDEANKEKLSGAVFKIAASKEDAEKGRFIQTEKDGKSGDYTITSDENGAAKFSALATGEYYIKEVSAPTGYVDVSGDDPFKVTIGNTKEQANVALSIANKKKQAGAGDDTYDPNDKDDSTDKDKDDSTDKDKDDSTNKDKDDSAIKDNGSSQNGNNNGGGYTGGGYTNTPSGYQSIIQYVKTGDYTKLWPWIALLAAAGIVIAVAGKKKKKKTPDR